MGRERREVTLPSGKDASSKRQWQRGLHQAPAGWLRSITLSLSLVHRHPSRRPQSALSHRPALTSLVVVVLAPLLLACSNSHCPCCTSNERGCHFYSLSRQLALFVLRETNHPPLLLFCPLHARSPTVF